MTDPTRSRLALVSVDWRTLSQGFKDALPMVLGVAPFGMIVGVSIVGIGLTAVDATLMSALVVAGAAQLAATALLGSGASVLTILLTVAVINLRHVMYSASLSPWLKRYGLGGRLLMSFVMVDQTYAMSMLRFENEGPDYARREYLLGVGLTMWANWVATTAIGALLGARLPATWQLDFTIPLVFLALLVPQIRSRPALFAALTGAGLALALAALPYNLGLIVGALGGIVAGTVAERALGRAASGVKA